MKKLNFGCGSIQPKDWDNVDADVSFAPAVDPGNYYSSTEDLPDNSYDIIVAHASIQQIPWHELVTVLRDLHRLLAAGGVLRISLPDINKGFEAYQKDDISFFPNGEGKIDDRFSAWLTWYSTSKTLLTQQALLNKLVEAGFSRVVPSSYRMSAGQYPHDTCALDTRENEFFFVEAFK